MQIIICVDAGGTTCKAGIFTIDGTIISRGYGKAGSPAVEPSNWYLNIKDSIDDALSNINKEYEIIYIEIGASGFSALSNHHEIELFFQKQYNARCNITSDTMTALYSVIDSSDERGIVVISGTGVAIFGKNHNDTYLVGGWGHLIRELGSAYAIVHDFVVELIDKAEALIPFDELDKVFMKKLKITNVREFNRLFYQHTKDEIASYSIIFKEQANLNNERAISLLYKEGINLAKQVHNLINLLKMPNKTKIGLKGGFIEHDGKYIVDAITSYFKENKLDLIIDQNPVEQLIGVYRLAKYNISKGI